jgi:hypothetical protein
MQGRLDMSARIIFFTAITILSITASAFASNSAVNLGGSIASDELILKKQAGAGRGLKDRETVSPYLFLRGSQNQELPLRGQGFQNPLNSRQASAYSYMESSSSGAASSYIYTNATYVLAAKYIKIKNPEEVAIKFISDYMKAYIGCVVSGIGIDAMVATVDCQAACGDTISVRIDILTNAVLSASTHTLTVKKNIDGTSSRFENRTNYSPDGTISDWLTEQSSYDKSGSVDSLYRMSQETKYNAERQAISWVFRTWSYYKGRLTNSSVMIRNADGTERNTGYTYTYDLAGNLTAKAYSTYDRSGKLVEKYTETRNEYGIYTTTNSYLYDGSGIRQRTYTVETAKTSNGSSSRSEIVTNYTQTGKISDWDRNQYNYDASGVFSGLYRMAQVNIFNASGVAAGYDFRTYLYDEKMRLTYFTINVKRPDGTEWQRSLIPAYGPGGRVVDIKDRSTGEDYVDTAIARMRVLYNTETSLQASNGVMEDEFYISGSTLYIGVRTVASASSGAKPDLTVSVNLSTGAVSVDASAASAARLAIDDLAKRLALDTTQVHIRRKIENPMYANAFLTAADSGLIAEIGCPETGTPELIGLYDMARSINYLEIARRALVGGLNPSSYRPADWRISETGDIAFSFIVNERSNATFYIDTVTGQVSAVEIGWGDKIFKDIMQSGAIYGGNIGAHLQDSGYGKQGAITDMNTGQINMAGSIEQVNEWAEKQGVIAKSQTQASAPYQSRVSYDQMSARGSVSNQPLNLKWNSNR